ncbi:MAG: hypothetical protein PW788_10595 [Micavibrio sp.]|nr:hypothetical protein [Micavibrio sp.]
MTTPEKAPETTQPSTPMRRKEAYTILGSAAFVSALYMAAPVLAVITVVALALPVTMDIQRHGKNNILRNSWNELKEAFGVVRTDIRARLAANAPAETTAAPQQQKPDDNVSPLANLVAAAEFDAAAKGAKPADAPKAPAPAAKITPPKP